MASDQSVDSRHSDIDNDAAYASRTTTQRRYWRRSNGPVAWWPWGLLPLLGLFLLFLWGALRTAPHIQADVQTEVDQALQAAGVTVSSVEADGQNVRVAASEAPVDERYVRAVAEAARCDTWLGRLSCPLDVDLSVARVAQAEPVAPVIVEAPAEPATRHHDFVFGVNDRVVTLSGEVSSRQEKFRLLNDAKARFEEVRDQLTVSGDVATPSEPLAANRAMAVLAGFQRGEARWTSGVLAARGRVATVPDADAVRTVFNAAERQPPLGAIEVQVAEEVNRCNTQLADTLNKSTINFRTSSAQIDAGNDVLLQSLAGLIESCPGTLTIEGHTDSVGDDAMNQGLSQARADAVLEALTALGVPAERLNARGFGESQPIADNATRAGRARNRRIVISIDDL